MVSTSTPDSRASRILVVDGDDSTGDSIRDVLRAQGYGVITARDGRAALEAMRAARIDIAVVDLALPDADAPELLEWIKHASPATEVVAVPKPFDPGELISSVHRAHEKQQIFRALRESEERYRLVTEHTRDAVYLVDLDGRITFVNSRVEEMCGYTRDELIGQSIFKVLTPEGIEAAMARRAALLAGHDAPQFYETEVVRKDGARIWAEVSATSVKENGVLIARLAVARDITERKRSELALRESEERLRAVFEQAAVGIAVVAADGRWLRVNQRLCDLVGYTAEEMLTMRYQDLTHPEDLDTSLVRRREMLEGEARPYSLEKRYLHRNGSIVWINLTTSMMESAPGNPAVSIAIIEDISPRKIAEAALHASEERFRATFEQASVGITIVAQDGRFLSVNQRFADMVGYTPAELAERCFQDITHPDDLELNVSLRRPMIEHKAPAYAMEKRYVHKDGSIVWAHVTASQARDAAGERGYSIGIVQDITERKALENELRHAQRMEGIGQLAGGIAHDFNNLLTVITGRSHLAASRLPATDPLRRELELIHRTAERAAALTRQLLAFSRKQVLQPKVVAINDLLAGAITLLKRLIGEHIELAFAPAADLGLVRVDPGQLEQVIVNLAVNGRDAMPDGGQLTLTTANVELDAAYASRHADVVAGSYVSLSVSDTGTGMTAEVQARLFEPFFTTKGPGKGTGLGLATVYGIVKQSDGHIRVSSAPGSGTTFTIYLPRTDGPPDAGMPPPAQPVTRGTETILLVEDEPEVRELAKEILEGAGYTVLEAAAPADAMLIARQHAGMIELLLTDVVMPRMSGRALAEAIVAERPETRVLFMSGYTDDAILRHGVLEAGVHFLEKPFTPRVLAGKVREVLDAP